MYFCKAVVLNRYSTTPPQTTELLLLTRISSIHSMTERQFTSITKLDCKGDFNG
jgi:hypothetical protein